MKKRIALLMVAVLALSVCAATAESWECADCGNVADGAFCNNCGAKMPGEDEGLSFREAMDEYEALIDEYIEFMKQLDANPSDLTLLMESMEMLSRYEEAMQAMEDLNDGTLSDSDMAYYTQVMLRISEKLMSVL